MVLSWDGIDDIRPESATAAVVLGRVGVFAGSVDGRTGVAAAVLVGDRDRGVHFRGVIFCSEAGLAGKNLLFGRVVFSGRFFNSGAKSGAGRTSVGCVTNSGLGGWSSCNTYGAG